MKARRRSEGPDTDARRTGDGGPEVAAASSSLRRKPRTAKQRVKRALLASGAAVVICTLGITSLGVAWLAGYKVPLATGATYIRVEKLSNSGEADAAAGPTTPFYIALIGNDDRPGVGGARGDALHLVGINPKLHKATMLDVPRDTCWAGDKINVANATGGAPAQAEALGGLIGVPVSYAVDVNFDGFISLVDGVGGFEMNIPFEMSDPYSGAYFQPGVQHMTGDEALRFSRDRHDFPQSDIVRTENQGMLILAGIAQMQKSAQTAGGQFKLIKLLYQHAQLANLGVTDLYRLGRLMYDIPVNNIRNLTIPVTNGSCLGLSGDAPGLFADFADDAVLQSH
jgi:LCP family protein required for cell wall assembly